MDCDDRDPTRDPHLTHGPDLAQILARWLAEARTIEAAGARERQHWLGRQLAEQTTLSDVLTELAERARPVVVRTVLGARHRATVSVVGADMVGLDAAGRGQVFLRTVAICSIRTRPGEDGVSSGHGPHVAGTFLDLLAAPEADRERVAVTTSGGDRMAGTLVGLGPDVVTIRLDGDHANLVYVPVDRVIEIAPTGS